MFFVSARQVQELPCDSQPAPVCSYSHLTKAGRHSERTSAVGLTTGGATEQQASHNNVKVVSPPLTPLKKTNKQDRE